MSAPTTYGHCSVLKRQNLEIQPLTNNHADITKQLESMWPDGSKHIALGMAFGWHVISPNAPSTEGVSYGDEDVLKAIVLLTDGDQRARGWGPKWGRDYIHTVPQVEKNLENMCEAIKKEGVMVITVAFDLRDRDTKERLQNCATSLSHYFDAITGQLVKNLHLSR